MSKLAMEMQLTSLPEIDAESVIALSGHDWPGNVRELRNVLERSLMLSDGQNLNVALPSVAASRREWPHVSDFPEHKRTLHDVTDEVIKSLCLEALRDAVEAIKDASPAACWAYPEILCFGT